MGETEGRERLRESIIRRLNGLARDWPRGDVYLYSANGSLHLMACDSTGGPSMTPGDEPGQDQSAILATFDIPNEGGDW